MAIVKKDKERQYLKGYPSRGIWYRKKKKKKMVGISAPNRYNDQLVLLKWIKDLLRFSEYFRRFVGKYAISPKPFR